MSIEFLSVSNSNANLVKLRLKLMVPFFAYMCPQLKLVIYVETLPVLTIFQQIIDNYNNTKRS